LVVHIRTVVAKAVLLTLLIGIFVVIVAIVDIVVIAVVVVIVVAVHAGVKRRPTTRWRVPPCR
jgi:hypothetical protein